MPVRVRNSAAARATFAADDGAEKRVVVAREVLRRAVQREVGAVLERPQVDRCRDGRVDDHRRGMRDGRSRSGIVRNGFDGASSQTSCDAVRRRAGLVELDVARAPFGERLEGDAGAEVRAGRERDRVARLRAARGRAPSSRRCPTERAPRRRRRARRAALRRQRPSGSRNASSRSRPARRARRRARSWRGRAIPCGEPTQARAGDRRACPCGRARGRASSRSQRCRSSRAPPATTAGTAPISEATAPDSNAPSSFEALMNTHSTALTRPWSCGGVSMVTAVWRMLTLIMSTKPVRASAASERGSHFDRPKTIIPPPKVATTTSSVGPAGVRSGCRASSTRRESAPTDGARTQQPRPIGPTCEDRAREHRCERDRVAEQHAEEVEPDRAQQHARPRDEADARDEAVPARWLGRDERRGRPAASRGPRRATA